MPPTTTNRRQRRATVLAVTPTGRNDDYAPTDLNTADFLRFGGTGSCILSGLAGGESGRLLTLVNASDGLLILENQSTDSTAANRFAFSGLPLFLMPNDMIQLGYDATSARWMTTSAQYLTWNNLQHFDDFMGSANTGTGYWSTLFSGTGTSAVSSTAGVNSTSRVIGALRLNLGTGTTARASLTSAGVSMVGALGPMMIVGRIDVENVPTASLPYDINFGFTDGAASASGPTEGVYWRGYWNSGASEARWSRSSGTTGDDESAISPITSDYIWLSIFVNAAASRADYIYSTNSMKFLLSGTRTTSLPTTSSQLRPLASMWKTSGATNRSLSIDLMGFRYDVARG